MKNIVIIGAGDLGRELVWLIEDINKVKPTYVILGFLDMDERKAGREFYGYEVLGTEERLEELGYQKAKVPTQTTSWLAVKVYLDLGFRPLAKNLEHSREGWRIVKALTGHPALAELDAASMEEILAG